MFDLIVCSPPYAAINVAEARHLHFDEARREKSIATKQRDGVPEGYGQTPGQLGSMKEGTNPGATPMQETEADQWTGLYSEGWQGVIVEDAFAHPAKYARALIRRIYEHLRCEKRIKPGDTVLDPFGGVALGALDAMFHGLNWIGVELESRFFNLGLDNINLWNERYRGWPGWGTARLLNGDSRRLAEVVEGAGVIVSSPPYAETFESRSGPSGLKGVGGTGLRTNGKPLGLSKADIQANKEGYGHSPGQLGAMPAGQIDAVLSSPPYAETVKGQHGETETADDSQKARKTKGGSLGQSQRHGGYGVTEGQLGALPVGEVGAVVSSPPYEASIVGDKKKESGYWEKSTNGTITGRYAENDYGTSPGQLGNTTGQTFWEASQQIVSQCYQLLKPGGVSCWVVKAFVRKGKIVDFPGQWRALCESVGFKFLHEHHAMLVTDAGEQGMLFGEPEKLRKEKKSFFRRLAEKKGSPAIDFETVLCLEK